MSSDRFDTGHPMGLLPFELMEMIVQELSEDDIVSLAKTCKLMHRRMLPFLYTELMISKHLLPVHDLHHKPSMKEFERTFFQEDGTPQTVSRLNFVNDLKILPVPLLFYRCTLARYLLTPSDPTSTGPPPIHLQVLKALNHSAKEIFSHLRKGKLQHFSWMLGLCMPEEVLGPQGYITLHQSNLRSLTLTVDGSCPGYGLDGLVQLNNLHHFSWRGIVTRRNFELFRAVLENNARHLMTLDVEVVRRPGLIRDPDEIEFDLFWLGLLVPTDLHNSRFDHGRLIKNDFRLKSLLVLTLRNVSLDAWKSNVGLTFDPEKLLRLSLELCDNTLGFFDTWDRRNHRLSLRSFRGIIEENWGTRTSFPLERLLGKYGSRLEEFYITFTNNFQININFHLFRHSLKRLVISFFRKSQGVRTEIDLPEMFGIRSILETFPRLQGLGFTRRPYFVTNKRKYLRNEGPFPNLKVMHFRASKHEMRGLKPMVDYKCTTKVIIDSIKQFDRYDTLNPTADILSELIEFATWAFDCTTLPNLEIVAIGDFSEPGDCFVLRHRPDLPRYSLRGYYGPMIRTFLTYRDNDSTPIIPFEVVRPTDLSIWEGLDPCRHMILTNTPDDPWDANT